MTAFNGRLVFSTGNEFGYALYSVAANNSVATLVEQFDYSSSLGQALVPVDFPTGPQLLFTQSSGSTLNLLSTDELAARTSSPI